MDGKRKSGRIEKEVRGGVGGERKYKGKRWELRWEKVKKKVERGGKRKRGSREGEEKKRGWRGKVGGRKEL